MNVVRIKHPPQARFLSAQPNNNTSHHLPTQETPTPIHLLNHPAHTRRPDAKRRPRPVSKPTSPSVLYQDPLPLRTPSSPPSSSSSSSSPSHPSSADEPLIGLLSNRTGANIASSSSCAISTLLFLCPSRLASSTAILKIVDWGVGNPARGVCVYYIETVYTSYYSFKRETNGEFYPVEILESSISSRPLISG